MAEPHRFYDGNIKLLNAKYKQVGQNNIIFFKARNKQSKNRFDDKSCKENYVYYDAIEMVWCLEMNRGSKNWDTSAFRLCKSVSCYFQQ